jgi:hypothetical protein
MTKKEVSNHLDSERSEDRSERNVNERKNSSAENERRNTKTEVKNAHATGLGAIGRNDQRVEKEDTDFSNY